MNRKELAELGNILDEVIIDLSVVSQAKPDLISNIVFENLAHAIAIVEGDRASMEAMEDVRHEINFQTCEDWRSHEAYEDEEESEYD